MLYRLVPTATIALLLLTVCIYVVASYLRFIASNINSKWSSIRLRWRCIRRAKIRCYIARTTLCPSSSISLSTTTTHYLFHIQTRHRLTYTLGSITIGLGHACMRIIHSALEYQLECIYTRGQQCRPLTPRPTNKYYDICKLKMYIQ